MFIFAAKSAQSDKSNPDWSNSTNSTDQWSEIYFSELAVIYVDAALAECGDDPPPISLLQALILTTHWTLIHGVRGRAWRYLGTCVRIAYELNLHLIDSGKPPDQCLSNSIQWCEDEERRRAWWAIWEMDVFASVIRRCPTAIDWSQNETFLPADDEKWFCGEPQASCCLELSLVDRWKALQASGNQSPKAWFIVVNSLMKEAQAISSPVGINKSASPQTDRQGSDFQAKQNITRSLEKERTSQVLQKLSTLYNTLRCFIMAMPQHLRYRNQYLSFGSSGSPSPRHLHSSIYSIHIMIQLTKLMIHKYHIFRSGSQWTGSPSNQTNRSDNDSHWQKDSASMVSRDRAFDQYFESADEILSVLHGSNENQYQYVNPFLANTIWLAAAVQLLHRELASTKAEKDLVNSNFEVLCMTYGQFVSYWNMSNTLSENLKTLATQLQSFRTTLQEHSNEQRRSHEHGNTSGVGRESNLHRKGWEQRKLTLDGE
jgi:Fungal specific transcription factor domain